MHSVTVRKEIADRVLQRRGRYHLFDRLDPARTALIVIDMQSTFCAPGSPAEVPTSRGIIEPINRLTAGLRAVGVPVFWVLHANERIGDKSDWELFFDTIVADDVRDKTLESLAGAKQSVWETLVTAPADRTVFKNRYSAFIAGSSPLERLLRGMGIDTVLVAGTKTNVCCESTARDAMMLDFKVVMVEDCCAALSDDEHRSALENVIQQFGDVMTVEEVLAGLRQLENDSAEVNLTNPCASLPSRAAEPQG
jgi:ureidoacrylate peracid hydrolase